MKNKFFPVVVVMALLSLGCGTTQPTVDITTANTEATVDTSACKS